MRQPLGTYTRNTVDWFAPNGGAGIYTYGGGAGPITGIGLYNDTTQGELLWIYWLGVNSPANSFSFYTAAQGSLFGAIQNKGAPLRADLGEPTGALVTADIGAAPFFALRQETNPGNGLTFPGYQENAPPPIKILPPGWTYLVLFPSLAGVSVSVRWLVLPGGD